MGSRIFSLVFLLLLFHLLPEPFQDCFSSILSFSLGSNLNYYDISLVVDLHRLQV
jgi:hypothetical protein